MTNEEQTSLWMRYFATKEQALRDELIALYLPLSHAVARRFTGRGIERDDLDQIAALALIDAVERYNPGLGFKFVTFAVPVIAGAIRHSIRDRHGSFRLSRDSQQLLEKTKAVKAAFEQKYLRGPTVQEIAEQLNIPSQDLLTVLFMSNELNTRSLDAVLSDDETAFSSLLGRNEEGYSRVDSRQEYLWFTRNLTESERRLLTLRFEKEYSQRETAVTLNISQIQVSRMERRLLRKLRGLLEKAEK